MPVQRARRAKRPPPRTRRRKSDDGGHEEQEEHQIMKRGGSSISRRATRRMRKRKVSEPSTSDQCGPSWSHRSNVGSRRPSATEKSPRSAGIRRSSTFILSSIRDTDIKTPGRGKRQERGRGGGRADVGRAGGTREDDGGARRGGWGVEGRRGCGEREENWETD